ncbi:dual specificity protein phosphatase family protein [Pseudomonas sp. LFM046]|uniref:dual specificity protein phosphatase family protein n=1 Tax=Pseudomonas sp. LFM046 TaxID=1608357 RepID=UPI0024133F62|nr:dual specificity protein phosphatase family protein [Pseudomonas sp. LFM046]
MAQSVAPLLGTARPANWAQPVEPAFNFYRMSPSLYRSALPHSGDVPLLEQLGVRTVVSFIKDDDAQWLGDAKVRTVSIPLHADRVDDADVIRVLGAVQAAERLGPVLIHCKHGRDRSGLMAAMYRTVVQGWSKEEALREMQQGGFGDPASMASAVAYVQKADVEGIRQAMARGECSTSWASMCRLRGWLDRQFADATQGVPAALPATDVADRDVQSVPAAESSELTPDRG